MRRFLNWTRGFVPWPPAWKGDSRLGVEGDTRSASSPRSLSAKSAHRVAPGQRQRPFAARTFCARLVSFLRSPLGGKLRRAYLTRLRSHYVREQARRRRGSCKGCGACCRFVFRCPYLGTDNRCIVYDGSRHRNCIAFPIDWRDLRDVNWQCGFNFDGHK